MSYDHMINTYYHRITSPERLMQLDHGIIKLANVVESHFMYETDMH